MGSTFFLGFSCPNATSCFSELLVIFRNLLHIFSQVLGPLLRLVRDRKRIIPDRKSAVFDLAKSFSFREQKLFYARSKNRLGFNWGVNGMPLFASSIADR